MIDEQAQRQDTDTDSVSAHYGRRSLRTVIQAGLEASGKCANAHLTADDLAPFDQFHTGGKSATLQLAELAAFEPGWRVLDVGGGLGGPARVLAEAYGCHVTVLDLTPAFCEVGAWLTERRCLGQQVQFRPGNALATPFPDAAFDAAWTQHSSMNIADKEQLYQEIFRIVRPGGRLALHEIMAGPAGDIAYPVPWAKDRTISHLRPAAEIRTLLRATGFRERAWCDTSAEAITWFETQRAAARAAPAPAQLGPHLLLGETAPLMVRNLIRNLTEERIVTIQAVYTRP